jgi:serine/threonine protein kinase
MASGPNALNESKDLNSTVRESSMNNDADDDGEGGDEPTENLMTPGTKISINDFKLLKVIGRGSFGKVYLVRKKDSGQPYALKILKKDQLIKKNLLVKTQGK